MTRFRFPIPALLAAVCAIAAVPAAGAAQTVRDVGRNVFVISKLGGKCFDVEGARSSNGTRLIGYACNGQSNQQFFFTHEGTIVHNGKCVDAKGGLGRSGDELVLWDCNGGPNQQWRLSNGRLIGINNKCVDLEGSSGHWFGNQRAILWDCHGADNQQWRWRLQVPEAGLKGETVLRPGAQGRMEPIGTPRRLIDLANGVIATGGGNVIATGGGNVIATGGGNVIATGGLN